MTNKKPPIHLIFSGIYFVLAVITLIPMETASKASFLGYKALCSFSPVSAIILLALGSLHFFLNKRNLV